MSLPIYVSRGPTRFLFHYVRRRLAGHVIVLSMVLAAVACSIGSQYAIKNLVDQLDARGSVWLAVAILFTLVAGDNLLWRGAGWVSSSVFPAVGGDIRLDLFDHLSGHGTRYFTERFPGALAGRISTAATATWTIENALTWTTIPPMTAVLSSIVLLATVNWQMMAVLTVIVVVLGFVIERMASRNNPLHESFAGRAAAVNGYLADVVGNIGLVRAFGTARREHARLKREIADEMSSQRSSLRSLEKLRLFHALTVLTVTAGVLVWSVALWQAGRITTGDVVLTTTLAFTVLHASRDLAMSLVELVQQFAKLSEAIQELGLPHEMQDSPEARPLINLGGSAALVNICFSYPNGGRVLQDFTLHIPAGQKIGIVGKSGSGKSTIFSLLQRFYDPERGHVLIDQQDIAGVTQESLRHSIAVVQQDISLLHRSIRENLRYGRPDATDAEVEDAAEIANCSEFIAALPEGMDTVVGERGAKLSGGQRQRLAIARAFLRHTPIVLLDEATSALDTDAEHSIQAALNRLVKGRTVIAIAHRLSTLNSFDRIVVLDRGRIVEDGPPGELLKRKGVYSGMYSRQMNVGRL
jgi:ATP-binding cassette subfamily B protein